MRSWRMIGFVLASSRMLALPELMIFVQGIFVCYIHLLLLMIIIYAL